jgi:DNA polymerase III subunit epsilon
MLRYFNSLWSSVPTCFIDTECTGLRIGIDKAVSVALMRFENQKPVEGISSFINPGMSIPPESTLIHGIVDDQVKYAPTIGEFFSMPKVKELLKDAQPGAYNWEFDREFVPAFMDDWAWPWVDPLPFIRKFDRFVKGKGRHKLEATCKRFDIVLENAHTADADTLAAGSLFYKLGAKVVPANYTLGQLLGWQQRVALVEWERFMQWKANQPPLEEEK